MVASELTEPTVTVNCTVALTLSRTVKVAEPRATPVTLNPPLTSAAVATPVLLLVTVYGAVPPLTV